MTLFTLISLINKGEEFAVIRRLAANQKIIDRIFKYPNAKNYLSKRKMKSDDLDSNNLSVKKEKHNEKAKKKNSCD